MPNWNMNSLSVKGTLEELKQFKEVAKGIAEEGETEERIIDFEVFIPYPKSYRDQDKLVWKYEELKKKEKEKVLTEEERNELALMRIEHEESEFEKDGFNRGGYNWCVDNWGTKWNACSPEIDEGEIEKGELWYHFDTAWSPPIPVIYEMSVKFPNLLFHLSYEEGGNGFEGDYEVKSGEILLDEERDFDYTKYGDENGN